ncbi:MAG: FG-GAP repeat protein [Planctomycetota bacterium]|jgi:hypothetical protein
MQRWASSAGSALSLTACITTVAGITGAAMAQGITQVKILPSDGAAEDHFAPFVSIDGDTAIAGANGNDDPADSCGSAYIFQRNQDGTNNWGEVVKITASDAGYAHLFGLAVSIAGDTAIVGAHENRPGAAYIFQRDQGGPNNWGEVAKLTGSDAGIDDAFGARVSIDGDIAIVGAPGHDGFGNSSGAAYVFYRNEGGPDNWGEVAILTASDAVAEHAFGVVSISGDTVIIGAPGDDTPSVDTGSAYIFQRDHGGQDSWGEVTKITASDHYARDFFGTSVSIDGHTAIIGSKEDDDDGSNSGSAYIFQRNFGGSDNWGEVTKITASDADAGDEFGRRVSIFGDRAVVGAPFNRDSGQHTGSAYVFARNQGGTNNWGEIEKLSATDAAAGDKFGIGVSISGDSVMVGANGDADNGPNSGSAYIVMPFPQCAADIDQNGVVNVSDFLILLGQWGPCPPVCIADIDGNGVVNVLDFLLLLAYWGPCP